MKIKKHFRLSSQICHLLVSDESEHPLFSQDLEYAEEKKKYVKGTQVYFVHIGERFPTKRCPTPIAAIGVAAAQNGPYKV